VGNPTLLVAEYGNNRVQEVDVATRAHVAFWFNNGELTGPYGVAANANIVAVSETRWV
jgi:hypothetical protein